MTPDRIAQAAATLAGNASSRHEARSDGAALGRAIIAEIRAKRTAAQQINVAEALKMEMTLLQLAAGDDEFIAEVADSALSVLLDARK